MDVTEITVKWKHCRDNFKHLYTVTNDIDGYNKIMTNAQNLIKEFQEETCLELIPLIIKLVDKIADEQPHTAVILLVAGYELLSGNDLTIDARSYN